MNTTIPATAQAVSAHDVIRVLRSASQPLTVGEIAARLGRSRTYVRAALNRCRAFVTVTDTHRFVVDEAAFTREVAAFAQWLGLAA